MNWRIIYVQQFYTYICHINLLNIEQRKSYKNTSCPMLMLNLHWRSEQLENIWNIWRVFRVIISGSWPKWIEDNSSWKLHLSFWLVHPLYLLCIVRAEWVLVVMGWATSFDWLFSWSICLNARMLSHGDCCSASEVTQGNGLHGNSNVNPNRIHFGHLPTIVCRFDREVVSLKKHWSQHWGYSELVENANTHYMEPAHIFNTMSNTKEHDVKY